MAAIAERRGLAPFYSSALNAETYDLGVGRGGPGDESDLAGYIRIAQASGRRVLELGSGTGRVAIALARAGLDVVGVELFTPMLDQARANLATVPADVATRVRLIPGDMTTVVLAEIFDTVLIPARAFAFLFTPAAQQACLERVWSWLRPGGTLVIDLFDPRLDLCLPGTISGGRTETRVDPATGRLVRAEIVSRSNDALAQVLREHWRFTELDPDGTEVRTSDEELVLRWTYRFEMRHLLALAGFADIVEQSDFIGSSPAYGGEQVWTCRRPDAT
jgi:predicted O-methyltransferase YrrM